VVWGSLLTWPEKPKRGGTQVVMGYASTGSERSLLTRGNKGAVWTGEKVRNYLRGGEVGQRNLGGK